MIQKDNDKKYKVMINKYQREKISSAFLHRDRYIYVFNMLTLFMALFFAPVQNARADIMSLLQCNTEKYPEMSGLFYILNSAGELDTNLQITDFRLTENSQECKILGIEYPQMQIPDKISSVITIDVSGSMNGSMLEMAKAAAHTWVNALPTNGSECALTSFTQTNNIVQDFTIDKTRLNTKIDGLVAGGGTSFDAACIDNLSGGLLIAERGQYKRVMILVTDGCASGSQQAIIDKANATNCIVYCVSLGQNCPLILKNISEATGGKWFDNVLNDTEVSKIFADILNGVSGFLPCTIRWEAITCGTERNVVLADTVRHLSDSARYSISKDLLPQVSLNPEYIHFGDVEQNITHQQYITINPSQTELQIDSIVSSNPDFIISDWDGTAPPFTMLATDTRTLTIDYTPTDSLLNYAYFTVYSSACDTNYFSADAGNILKGSHRTLELIHPDCDSTVYEFGIGGDTVVTWTGISPADKVQVEYSFDAGNSWILLSDSASDLKYNWKNIPKPASDSCLVKINHIDDSLRIIQSDTTACFFKIICPDFYITANNITLEDVEVGKWRTFVKSYFFQNESDFNIIIQNVFFEGDDAKYFFINQPVTPDTIIAGGTEHLETTFMPDYARVYSTRMVIATQCDTLYANIKATAIAQKVESLIDYIDFGELCLNETADTTIYVVRNSSISDMIINGALLMGPDSLSFHIDEALENVTLAPGDEYPIKVSYTALTPGLTSCELRLVYDATNYETIRLYGEGIICAPVDVIKLTFPNCGERLPIGCDTVITWSGVPSYQKVKIEFSRNGGSSWTILSETASYYSWIWNDLQGPASDDCLVRVTSLSADNPSVDVSDCTFSIVCPELQTIDSVHIKSNLIVKDTTIENILNSVDFPVSVRDMYFEGGDAAYFKLMENKTAFVLSKHSPKELSVRFSPDEMRIYQTTLIIITECETKRINFTADVSVECIELLEDKLDFNQVVLAMNRSITIPILNNCGNLDYEIEHTELIGNNKQQFDLPNNIDAFTIAIGDTSRIDLRYTAMTLGKDSCELHLTHKNGVEIIRLFGESILDSTVVVDKLINEIDFGGYLLALGKDTLDIPMIINNSEIDIMIDDVALIGNNDGAFSILNLASNTFVLQKDSIFKMDLAYIASRVGTQTATVEFTYDKGKKQTISLLGTGRKEAPDFITLQTENISHDIGKAFKIPIYIDIPEAILIDINIDLEVVFDWLPLTPAVGYDTLNYEIIDSLVRVKLPSMALPKDTVGRIQLSELNAEAVLCQKQISSIAFENYTLDYPGTELRAEKAQFHVTGLCGEGGIRLIGIHDTPQGIDAITPNPASSDIIINYTMIEDTHCKIYIRDMNGRNSAPIVDENLTTGEYSISTALNDYATGLYFIVFETRGQLLNYRLIIEK